MKRPLTMNKKLLIVTSYLGYFLIGLISIVLSPSLPFMIKDFNISLSVAGAAFTARAGGNLFGIFMGGILADRFGKKPLVIIGCLVQGITMAAIAAAKSWYLILLLFIINGIAGGLLNTSLNTLTAEINAERRGAALNALHGVYGLGSLIGPVAVGLVLTRQFGWNLVFYGASALWIIYLMLILVLRLPIPETAKEKYSAGQQKQTSVKSYLLHPIFIILCSVSFIYNGSAVSLVGWINTYMNEMQFSTILGSSMVTLFYIGLTIGRFLCSIFSDRAGYSRTILVCSIGSLLFYPLAIYSSHITPIAIGVFLSGLFFSGLHPTGLAYANKLFPASAGAITGILSTAMSLGAMVVPWLVGLISDNAGFRTGLGLGFALLFFLMAAALRLIYLEKKLNNSHSEFQ